MTGGPWNDFHVMSVALTVSAICDVGTLLVCLVLWRRG